MSYNKIEKKVLSKVTPTEKYRNSVNKITKELENILTDEIQKRKLPVKIELVGSIAKDTYLMNNMDIDFFLCFPSNYSKDEISKNALTIGKKILKNTEESYAEHPYIRGYYDDFYIEIVPCYQIKKAIQKLSAVDRTPLHTKYVKENIKEKQKQEVRLFKQFLKGINCYGAEAQVEGFSGYLCEIIILYYKNFENTLKNAKNWRYGEKLSTKKGKYQDFDTPLVFIDPVDPDRNVASAVSKEKFDLFIKASKKYLENPKITFFFPNKVKPWSLEKIKKETEKQDAVFTIIKLKKPNIIDENLYPQIKKGLKSIIDNCKRADFKIFDANYFVDNKNEKIFLIIKSKNEILSKSYEHIGPPVKVKQNSKDFIKKWKDNPLNIKGPYTKNERYYVEVKRQYRKIEGFLKDNIKNLSMGKDIDKIISKNYKILKIKDLLKEEFRLFWTQYLDGIDSWER